MRKYIIYNLLAHHLPSEQRNMPRNSVPLFPSRLFHQQIDILLLTVYEVNIQYHGRNSSVLSLVSCLIHEKINYRPRQNNGHGAGAWNSLQCYKCWETVKCSAIDKVNILRKCVEARARRETLVSTLH